MSEDFITEIKTCPDGTAFALINDLNRRSKGRELTLIETSAVLRQAGSKEREAPHTPDLRLP